MTRLVQRRGLRRLTLTATLLLTAALLTAAAPSGPAPQPAPLVDAEGIPTYKADNGKVDPGTYNGFRRYHASCHVCHGPDGLGGSFAPALTESLKKLDFWTFTDVVVNGRKVAGATGDRVMPSFGTDPNVMDHLDDIYRYLKARSDGKVERGRPERLSN
ncbi:c-type cytochrome [Oleisolibacter albus]|uniref:c-type cytochrome n=1 Tax=Oleisolibacter albus TaxID=2171757 RepID=UPI001EFE1AE8|nr:c-type cytochrome [Oleisolibacter albus]